MRSETSPSERTEDKAMKLFKHLEENFYYTQERHTLRWYPDLQWRHEIVLKPEGQLLAEGALEDVMAQAKSVLPPDLYEEIIRFYQMGKKGFTLP